MAKDSNIGWTHHTVNFWWGCVEYSPACVNCYAREYDKMRGPLFDNGLTHWGKNAPRWMRVQKAILELRMHDAAARKAGVRHRVFINSMSDFFEQRPDLEDARLAAFEAFAACTNLDILLLTKRAEYAADWLGAVADDWRGHAWARAWDNIWLGFTGEDQHWFDLRWHHVSQFHTTVFCSYEPACGPLVLPDTFLARGPEAWLIVGGESGPHRREWELAWLERVVAQCVVAGVPVYVKQDSGLYPGQQGRIPDVIWAHKDFPEGETSLLNTKLSGD